ncbi:MAG: N-glycosylase/DNA lyase [Candidatus Aenigmatarchaeota archaeon]
MSNMREELLGHYESKKAGIKGRLVEFKKVRNAGDERIFTELCFCICTPQSRAVLAWAAMDKLSSTRLLFTGSVEQISAHLRQVRFGEKKAAYIVEARKKFTVNSKIRIKEFIQEFMKTNSAQELREWIDDNVKGIGMKEASHFLRNIGFRGLAILDSHILENLKEFDVINEVPKSMTRRQYLEIEEKMKEFSQKIGIPFDELDLTLWSKETGFVFK